VIGLGLPGHFKVQLELAEHVTVQLSVQTTSQVAPFWQVAEPLSPIVI
jgi:hypothetical protein